MKGLSSKLVYHKMLRTTQQAKYFKVIEWCLFFGLCGLSGFFMRGVLNKFFSGKTSVTQSEDHIKELPTVTLCFSMPSTQTTEYKYGSDFKIDYQVYINQSFSTFPACEKKVWHENF